MKKPVAEEMGNTMKTEMGEPMKAGMEDTMNKEMAEPMKAGMEDTMNKEMAEPMKAGMEDTTNKEMEEPMKAVMEGAMKGYGRNRWIVPQMIKCYPLKWSLQDFLLPVSTYSSSALPLGEATFVVG